MEIQLIRHATMLIKIKEKKLLLDPMFSPKGTLDAVPGVLNTNKNPLTDLPVELGTLLNIDSVLVTHTHRDHFDNAAIDILPKNILIIGQQPDAKKLAGYGFTNIKLPQESFEWNGIEIFRTSGQHGTGDIGQSMGPVSGFVLRSLHEPSIYIVGDSILCDEVEQALNKYRPDITICYAGAAQFSSGEPITMTEQDVCRLARKAPYTKIIVTHMESWNHCALSRLKLKQYINKEGLSTQIYVPDDGEIMSL
ncbi:MBL fold metallo-hydrolase [Desulfitobacterium sp. Sab5]|uniref:MBL fold metallo-hydrolase n=1 Tax=Desulfitobacterium nosdiversum TaxID=3375356 RepID=UPI003CEC286E